ncbi:flagellar hook-length control protein FliK [Peteryoungia desertarenae]|uniref:Flagellar hook-length control protein FliK n=1 Tax=Peteryoungia desertarenae TaxID=1813451 RepID=A0ABX6QM25_9HYPH|nr:flagellar hook-length control protein FliK [Peteryoungia desertarenae]QLF69376.1 flagellar hook-length control protein FliK [Peteryoungia desertarenae]
MMDAVAAPKVPSKDAVVSQGSGRADKSDEGGFTAVLSNSGSKREDAKAKEAEADQEMPRDGEQASSEAQDPGKAEKRPTIDISFTGLPKAQPTDRQSQQSKQKGENTDLKDGTIATEMVMADASAEKAEEVPDPHRIAQLLKEASTPKTTGIEEVPGQEATDEKAAVVPADESVMDLGDVLQLLAGGQKNAKAPDAKGSDGGSASKDDLAKAVESRSNGQALLTDENGRNSSDDDLPSDQDRSFRFVRADGKGQPLALQAGNERSGSDTVETPRPAGIETISVIDSRRYIAPVSTNALNISSAILGDGDWVRAMSPGSELANAAAQSTAGKVVHTLKLQMSPIELGNVTATLKLNGDQLTVQLTVENHAAQAQLMKDQDEMLKALKAQGFAVEQVQVSVQVASTDRSADSGQNGTNQQNGQLAQQSNQGADQQGRQTGQSSAGNSGMRGDDASSAPKDSGHDRGRDADRSGGIYI